MSAQSRYDGAGVTAAPAISIHGPVKRFRAIAADLHHFAFLIAFALLMWRVAVGRLRRRLIE